MHVCTKVCVRVRFFGSDQGSRYSSGLVPRTHVYFHRHNTHRGDLGTACRGHVEVCAAVAQPECRSTASSTSPVPAKGDQIPGSKPSQHETPLGRPKCKFRTSHFRNTRLKGEDNVKEDGIPLRAEFGELFRGFLGFYFLNALFSRQLFCGSHIGPHLPQ